MVKLLTLLLGLNLSLSDGSWSESAPLVTQVQEIYPTLHQDALWLAGGLTLDANGSLDIEGGLWRLANTSSTWTLFTQLPEPIHHGFLVSANANLYLIGGFNGSQTGGWVNRTQVYRLNLDDKSWEQLASMPFALSETVAAVWQGRIHLATGRSPATQANSNWQDHSDTSHHLIFDTHTNEWQQGPSANLARNSGCSVQIDDQWHLLGGRVVGGANLATHQVYNFSRQQWSRLSPMPEARGGIACATLAGAIYVFGGEYFDANGGGVYSSVMKYTVKTDTWETLGDMPVPRHGLGAVSWQQSIWVIGGAKQAGAKGTSDRVSVFTP